MEIPVSELNSMTNPGWNKVEVEELDGDGRKLEGFGKSYEPFNPMDYEGEEQAKGQKRVATAASEGEEERVERGESGEMHLGWLHEAR